MEADDLVTLGQLADELTLARSAVSNWALRYTNFPQPKRKFGRANVYSRAEILEWRDSGQRSTPKRFHNKLWLDLSPESRKQVETLMRKLAIDEGLLDN